MQKGSSLTLRKLIHKYLDVLHIKLDHKIGVLSIQSSDRIISQTTDNLEFVAMKIIGDASVKTRHIFTISEINDFLTILANSINAYNSYKDYDDAYISNIIFVIYKDLTENYSAFDDSLKLVYPRIILDVVSILINKVDTKGRKVGVYGALNYYDEKKHEYNSYYKNYKHHAQEPLDKTRSNTKINSKAVKIDSLDHQLKDKDRNILLSDNNNNNTILDSLTEITGRDRKDLSSSLSNLSDIDLKRLKDLCNNYDRLRKYCKLAINEKEFRKEAEKDTGKKLGDNQIYHAISSVKKVKIYVENVLDHKFEPDESHGINHIKHNLEYGYLLIGLIESSRKPRKLF
jgi:predicted transcriptional regulator